MAEVKEELKSCPFCGRSIDIEKDVYEPRRDWHPTFIDPDSGGDPINIHCKCGLEFCTGTYDWGEFVEAWNRRVNDGKINCQPTAYDPDKVVKQLEDCISDTEDSLTGTGARWAYKGAIEIVKGGGVE